MATYELYYGGGRQQNNNFTMFPSAPFTQAIPYQPAVKQIPVAMTVDRTYDFGNDVALQNFMSTITLASGDKFGSVVIPEICQAVGVWWSVNTPLTGGAFALATRLGGTAILAATTTGTANSNFIPWPGGSTYFGASDILDVTWSTVPASGMGNLSLSIAVLVYNFRPSSN